MADSAILSRSFPLEISVVHARIRTMHRPRTWQMFHFMYTHACVFYLVSPPFANSILLSFPDPPIRHSLLFASPTIYNYIFTIIRVPIPPIYTPNYSKKSFILSIEMNKRKGKIVESPFLIYPLALFDPIIR